MSVKTVVIIKTTACDGGGDFVIEHEIPIEELMDRSAPISLRINTIAKENERELISTLKDMNSYK